MSPMYQLLQKILLLMLFFVSIGNLNAQTNNAINFDGIDDNIQITHFNRPKIFTLELWVINPTLTGEEDILSWSNSAGGYTAELVQEGDSVYYAEWTDPNWCTSVGANIGDGNWHHIAVVRDGNGPNNVTIYKDGQLVGKSTVDCYGPTDDLRIGAENYLGVQRYFNGTIDNLRLWNYARTKAQIIGHMNQPMNGNETGLLFNFNFDQGVANGTNTGVTTLDDNSSKDKNGTLNNFALSSSTSNWVGGCPAAVTGVLQNTFTDKFSVYPNPTQGNFEIKFEMVHGNLTARLLNSNAHLLETKSFQNSNSVQFDISYPAGIYLIEVIDENGNRAIMKVVKER